MSLSVLPRYSALVLEKRNKSEGQGLDYMVDEVAILRDTCSGQPSNARSCAQAHRHDEIGNADATFPASSLAESYETYEAPARTVADTYGCFILIKEGPP